MLAGTCYVIALEIDSPVKHYITTVQKSKSLDLGLILDFKVLYRSDDDNRYLLLTQKICFTFDIELCKNLSELF